MTKPALGVCYYPEHWPERLWQEDAKKMVDAGLKIVRIGEFAWSRLEPKSGDFHWQWLDRAIEVLGDAGLRIVLGTPTATPPRWMLDQYPDMLAVDSAGMPKTFGSRRHYCFSHVGYKEESARIASHLAARYGQTASLCAWQIDNEYGCHGTVLSYSEGALIAFRQWLQDKYHNIEALNLAWGNVFWSMEYGHFEQIDLPHLTVAEANPAHVLDFRRFSSDQVVIFNRGQVSAIRAHSQLPLVHNYMGQFTGFDHYQTGADLDIAAWDSYPLGFLQKRLRFDENSAEFIQQGDPDFQAFHHDLYRSVGKGRWWVMEQQPGPVNWAAYNLAPLPGMVRLWTWEAIAHQAEAVCYFRWRQAPFAQEQMHAGLLHPDSSPAVALAEVVQTTKEIEALDELTFKRADVAIVFDYESCWAWDVQPQGKNFRYFNLVFDYYRGLRKLGLSVDFISARADSLNPYKLVLVPGLMHWTANMVTRINDFKGQLLIGPRSGSKTAHFSMPDSLPPAIAGFDCKVTYVESLPPEIKRPVRTGGSVHTWMESLEIGSSVQILESTQEDQPTLVAQGPIHYLGGWPDDVLLESILQRLCKTASIATIHLPAGLRVQTTASHRFIFNYNRQAVAFEGQSIAPASVTWQSLK